MAGAGNREGARCGGGHISWQAQYFVRASCIKHCARTHSSDKCDCLSEIRWRAASQCVWVWLRERGELVALSLLQVHVRHRNWR